MTRALQHAPTAILILVSALVSTTGGFGAESVPTRTIPKLNAEVELDGVSDESVWQHAWSTEMSYEVNPAENTPAPVRTEVLVFYTTTHLFVAIRAHDPEPEAIRAHLADRDNLGADDWAGVVLDTFNDERRNYVLLVNPLGVQFDKIEIPDGSTVWDGIWDAAAQITDWGWGAELKIPFSTLRFQRAEGPQIWGFDAVRGYPRSVFRQMGAFPRDRNNNCYLCQAIKIEGFEGVSPGRNVELVPTLTAARREERSVLPDGPYDLDEDDVELGLTARWGFTPNLTLAGTLNPDFSQVEADARQLDINRPFALFFDEKRPFFMEGADIFTTWLDAVYTRTIRQPSWGIKLSGKEGEHTVGAYVVEDDLTNLIFPGAEGSDATSLEQSNLASVLRYKRDLGNRYTLGALVTAREGDRYHNRVAGIDGVLRLTPTDKLTFQALSSDTRYPEEVAAEFGQPEGDFSDQAFSLYYSHDTRSLSWWAWYDNIGADFRADLGFIPQVDFLHYEAGASYQWIGTPETWYSNLTLIGKYLFRETQDGDLLNEEYALQFVFEGPLQSHGLVRPSHEREGFAGEEFEIDQLRLHMCLKPDAHSHAWMNLTVGDEIDHANVQAGDLLYFNGGFWYHFGAHLFIQPDYSYEEIEVPDGWLYEARIAQLTTTWQFNARTFVRAILQHVDYRHNAALYTDEVEPEYRHLFSQLLFSYKLNPRTVFFLGYSDNSFGTEDYELTRANRTVFAKLGYAWVF